jgi:DNA-binding IscR family transcriptional regulator
VEGSLELVSCVHSKTCPEEAHCISRHTWSELYREIQECVDSITLQSLVEAYNALDKLEYAI